MEILFLTPEIPHPPRSGGTLKTALLLAHLGERHAATVLCFARRPPTEEQRRWMAERGGVATVPLDRGRTPVNLLRSYGSGLPLSVERNRSRQMAALVRDHVSAKRYDVVFVDSWLMAQYVPRSAGAATVLHQHNAEHLMWRRQLDLERRPVRRALVGAEYRRVRRYEGSILRRFDAVLAVSEADRRALVALGADARRVRLVPNVADPDLLEPPLPSAAQPVLLFVGTLSWEPNARGLALFLRRGLPAVRRRTPGLRFVIAGHGDTGALARLAARTSDVELLGPVADPEPLYRSARVFLDPSRGGGGTRVKVLNAMARGLPVVATPDAVEGLDAVPDRHLVVARNDVGMADAVIALMSDAERRRQLGLEGRRLVRERYVPPAAFAELDEVLAAGDR